MSDNTADRRPDNMPDRTTDKMAVGADLGF